MTATTSKTRVHFFGHSGSSFVSKLIQWQTRSIWNHISIRVDDLVYESIEGVGVRVRSLDQIIELHTSKKEKVIPLRLNVQLTQDRISKLRDWLHDQIGKKYDYTMVARFVSRNNRESNDSRASWFCSEMAFAGLQHIGVTLLRDTAPWEVSPGFFVRSPLLVQEPNDWFDTMRQK